MSVAYCKTKHSPHGTWGCPGCMEAEIRDKDATIARLTRELEEARAKIAEFIGDENNGLYERLEIENTALRDRAEKAEKRLAVLVRLVDRDDLKK